MRDIFRWREAKERPRSSSSEASLPRDALENHGEELSEDVLCRISGDGGAISSLVLLPDGKQLVNACKGDRIIRSWIVENGQEVKPPMNLDVAVNAIAASKNGEWLVSGTTDGNVMIWNTTTHQKVGESNERHELKVTTLDVSPDSLRAASGSDDGTIMVWRIDSEPVLHRVLSPLRYEDSSPVSSVKFSPTGARIASGYFRPGRYTVQIWCSWTGEQLASFLTDGQPTRSLAWTNDGRRLFAGGPHGLVRCFDVATQRRLAKWEDFHSDVITSLYVSNTGQLLISASASGRTIDIWDIRDISACKRLHSYRHSDVLSIAISPDGRHLFNGGKNRNIYKRCLSKVIDMSYFYHCLTSSQRLLKPLMYINNAAYEKWKDGKLVETEAILSTEITEDGYRIFVDYARVNRSLVRARLQKWNGALEDAEATISHGGQTPLIAYIAKGIALYGLGKQEEAVDAFEAASCRCDGDTEILIEHIKLITFFEAELRDNLQSGAELPDFHQAIDVCPLVNAQKLILLAELHIRNGNHEIALQLLSGASDLGSFLFAPEAKIVLLIFGWNIHDLHFMISQLKFQALAASGHTKEAVKLLCADERDINEEIETRKGILGQLCEKFGDKSICHTKYDDAINWYSLALALLPEARVADKFPDLAKRCLATFEIAESTVYSEKDEATVLYIDLLSAGTQKIVGLRLKRSKAGVKKELWKEALDDANEAIRLDPLCPWGYEQRRIAMLAGNSNEKGIDVSNDIPSMVERQVDLDISQLQQLGPVSREVVIDAVIHRIANICPLVLIDVKTGLLCNDEERKRIFKEDRAYDELPSSATTQLDRRHIIRVVAQFFRYVMFSHTWEGQEPTLQDVEKLSEKSVYRLDPSSPLNVKLHKFCEVVRDDPKGYRWSWSDTCCIDKTVEAVYKKSIRSMYEWYKWSDLTLILLVDISKARPRELKESRWMTRAWTLQELLSPQTIRFYDREWKPYQGDTHTNHKKSSHILRELAEAIHVTPDALTNFSPETLGVREKLRLASTRNATKEEDIAYSLIGIFSSNLIPEPRDATIALGLLLQEVVERYQESTVFDWTGEQSKFNSCLPARISVYSQPPYIVPPIASDDMEKQVASLGTLLSLQQDGTQFYDKLSHLEPLLFANQRLHLPCITFPITVTKHNEPTRSQTRGRGTVYLAKTAALGEVEFTTSESVPSQGRLMLVYPWIRDLLTQAHSPEGNPHTQTSRLVVYLEQGFRALLLAKHRILNEYWRIGSDNEIFVSKRRLTSLKDVGIERLVVLPR